MIADEGERAGLCHRLLRLVESVSRPLFEKAPGTMFAGHDPGIVTSSSLTASGVEDPEAESFEYDWRDGSDQALCFASRVPPNIQTSIMSGVNMHPTQG